MRMATMRGGRGGARRGTGAERTTLLVLVGDRSECWQSQRRPSRRNVAGRGSGVADLKKQEMRESAGASRREGLGDQLHAHGTINVLKKLKMS